jgi:hypothetical protein
MGRGNGDDMNFSAIGSLILHLVMRFYDPSTP